MTFGWFSHQNQGLVSSAESAMRTAKIKYTDVFEWNLEAYQKKTHRVIANQGSTRSGKTYSISQLLALYIPHTEKVTISVVSPSLPHLKRHLFP